VGSPLNSAINVMEINILVLGEETWVVDPGVTLYCEKDYSKVNIYHVHNKGLFYLRKDFSWVKIDGIIWRGQFESNSEKQKYILEIIKLSDVTCINHPDVTLNCSSNLSMYYALFKAKMPVLQKQISSFGKSTLDFIEPDLPCVCKLGNYHMGYGKMLVRNSETWRDFIDTAVLLNEPITIEPYINYKVDIRCLYIGGQMKCIERKPNHWKANVNPAEVISYDAPKQLLEMTADFASAIGADVIGTDWILDENDNWKVLECNTGPGLVNFEQDCRLINEILLKRIDKKQ